MKYKMTYEPECLRLTNRASTALLILILDVGVVQEESMPQGEFIKSFDVQSS